MFSFYLFCMIPLCKYNSLCCLFSFDVPFNLQFIRWGYFLRNILKVNNYEGSDFVKADALSFAYIYMQNSYFIMKLLIVLKGFL